MILRCPSRNIQAVGSWGADERKAWGQPCSPKGMFLYNMWKELRVTSTRGRKTLVSKWSHVCSLLLILVRGKEANHHFLLRGRACRPWFSGHPGRPEIQSRIWAQLGPGWAADLWNVQCGLRVRGPWDYQPQSSACCPLTILVQPEPSWAWTSKSKKPALVVRRSGLQSCCHLTHRVGWENLFLGPRSEATPALPPPSCGCLSAQAILETYIWPMATHTKQHPPKVRHRTLNSLLLSPLLKVPFPQGQSSSWYHAMSRRTSQGLKIKNESRYLSEENIFYNTAGERPF